MKLLIKIGGTLVDNPASRASLAREIAALAGAGHQVAVVHGGGRQLTRFLEVQGIESRFMNGLRVTTAEAIDAVVKVLAGSVNKELTGALQAAGANAVGISGIDGRLTTATQLNPDLGRVGRIEKVDWALPATLLEGGFVPVIACVAGDDSGSAWNINADQMAAACAASFGADRLFFLTDVAGVWTADGKVLRSLTAGAARGLIESGVAVGGMRAKLDAVLSALSGGVRAVSILPGGEREVVQRAINNEAIGTSIAAESVTEVLV